MAVSKRTETSFTSCRSHRHFIKLCTRLVNLRSAMLSLVFFELQENALGSFAELFTAGLFTVFHFALFVLFVDRL